MESLHRVSNNSLLKQAGAELCQAQIKLSKVSQLGQLVLWLINKFKQIISKIIQCMYLLLIEANKFNTGLSLFYFFF